MSYLNNSSGESLDVFIIKARPTQIKNESNSNLLNGGWFIQTIGTAAEKLIVQLTCSWDTLQELFDYADTKETMTINHLDLTKDAIILGQPAYDVALKKTVPLYLVDFEMAVIPNV